MSANQKITRQVAIYARKSKDLETSESCLHQISICKNKINQLDSKYNYEIYRTYTDDGKSGKDLERPAMKQLISDVRGRKIDVLIIYKMDRLSRKLRDIFDLMDFLEANKVDVVSCTDKDIDTTTAYGKMFFTITMAFAQLERDLASDRNKDMGLQASVTGKFMGGKVPFGYTLTRENVGVKSLPKLIINETEAQIVKQIFKRYLDGQSDDQIAEWLNLSGIEKSKQGINNNSTSVWINSNIANLITDFRYLKNTEAAYEYLTNEKIPYVRKRFEEMKVSLDISKWSEEKFKLQKGDAIGLLVDKNAFNGERLLQRFDGKISVLDAEPIIEDHVWIEAQRLRKRKATNPDHTRKARSGENTELLTNGLGVCCVCNKPITIRRATEKMKTPYYSCYNKGGFDKDRNVIPKCNRCYKSINAAELDSNIVKKLKDFFNNKDIIEDIIRRDKNSRQNINDEIEKELKGLEKQRTKLIKEIDNITDIVTSIDDIKNNPLLINAYIKKQEQLSKQLEELDKQIIRLKVIPIEKTEKDYTKEELLLSVDSFAQLFDYATDQEKKILVHYLVKRVIVDNPNRFEIELRFFEDFPKGTYLKSIHNNEDTPQGIRIVRS